MQQAKSSSCVSAWTYSRTPVLGGMAARHLQRLRQADDLSSAAAPESESDADASPVPRAAPFNPFDLLSDDEVRIFVPLSH